MSARLYGLGCGGLIEIVVAVACTASAVRMSWAIRPRTARAVWVVSAIRSFWSLLVNEASVATATAVSSMAERASARRSSAKENAFRFMVAQVLLTISVVVVSINWAPR